MFFLPAAHAFERPFHDEGGELFAVDFGKHDEDVGESAVRDPHLLAIEHEAAVGLLRRAGLGAERVRTGAGLAQAVRAHELAGCQLRQVLLLLLLGSKEHQRQRTEIGLCAECRSERGGARHLLAHDHRGHFVEAEAAIRLGDVGAEQPELAAPLQQLARERPLFLLETIELGQHLVVDKGLRRLSDEAMFGGQALGGEHGVRVCILDQPLATLQDGDRACGCDCHLLLPWTLVRSIDRHRGGGEHRENKPQRHRDTENLCVFVSPWLIDPL